MEGQKFVSKQSQLHFATLPTRRLSLYNKETALSQRTRSGSDNSQVAFVVVVDLTTAPLHGGRLEKLTAASLRFLSLKKNDHAWFVYFINVHTQRDATTLATVPAAAVGELIWGIGT